MGINQSKFTDLRDEIAESAQAGWIMTYGDLMSQLLVFFILILSMSTIDTNKFTAMTASVQDTLQESAANVDNKLAEFKQADLDKIKIALEKYIEENKLQNALTLDMTGEGLKILMSAARFFDSGDDQLLPASIPMLNQIGKQLRYTKYMLRVEGHTDDIPIKTIQFPSNWYLSSARACSVIKYLAKTGIDPKRMSAVGLAEFRPKAPNDSPENRAQNRRVELMVLRFME